MCENVVCYGYFLPKKFKLPFLKNEASPSFNSKSHRANSLENTCSYFYFIFYFHFFVIFACRSKKNSGQKMKLPDFIISIYLVLTTCVVVTN